MGILIFFLKLYLDRCWQYSLKVYLITITLLLHDNNIISHDEPIDDNDDALKKLFRLVDVG